MPQQHIDLAYAARLPPKEAVAYFRSKGFNITWNWYEQAMQAHAHAFTVAKAVRLDVLNTLRNEVERAIHDGITRKEFTAKLAPRLQKLGWWGKQIVVDSTGAAKEIQLGSPRRLATIYSVNIRTAYNAGRYAQMMNTADLYPYWQYVAVMDERTRPEHAKLHNLVFRYDDIFWKTHYPPNGWVCRCRVRALSEARLRELGLKVSYGASFIQAREVDAGIDEATGEVFRVSSTTFDNGRIKVTPDVGWSYNVGSAAFGTDIAMIRKLIETRDAALREQVIQVLNNSPERQLAFSLWARKVLVATNTGHSVQTLGFMNEVVAIALRERLNTEPARLLVVSESALKTTKAPHNYSMGTAAEPEDMANLPAVVASPQAVLWDKQHGCILYVKPTKDGRAYLVVSAQLPKDTLLNVPVFVWRIEHTELRAHKLDLLTGSLER